MMTFLCMKNSHAKFSNTPAQTATQEACRRYHRKTISHLLVSPKAIIGFLTLTSEPSGSFFVVRRAKRVGSRISVRNSIKVTKLDRFWL